MFCKAACSIFVLCIMLHCVVLHAMRVHFLEERTIIYTTGNHFLFKMAHEQLKLLRSLLLQIKHLDWMDS